MNPLKAFFQHIQFKIKKRKQSLLKKQLLDKYQYIVDEYKSKDVIRNKPENAFPVWLCWWQGEENMPELVKACYSSLCRNANGHPIHLITKDNYKEYVVIPDYILEKMDSGNISITHFSDILRVHLLYEHGGLWIDSTMLVTAPLPESLDHAFFSIKHKKKGQHVSGYRWTAFLLYAEKGNLLVDFMKTFFLEYWKKEDELITYLMIDYVIAIAYNAIPEVTKMIDAVPYNNLCHNELRYQLKSNKPYNSSLFEKICSETYLHKLTWKRKFLKETKNGQLTFYKHIIEEYN